MRPRAPVPGRLLLFTLLRIIFHHYIERGNRSPNWIKSSAHPIYFMVFNINRHLVPLLNVLSCCSYLAVRCFNIKNNWLCILNFVLTSQLQYNSRWIWSNFWQCQGCRQRGYEIKEEDMGSHGARGELYAWTHVTVSDGNDHVSAWQPDETHERLTTVMIKTTPGYFFAAQECLYHMTSSYTIIFTVMFIPYCMHWYTRRHRTWTIQQHSGFDLWIIILYFVLD